MKGRSLVANLIRSRYVPMDVIVILEESSSRMTYYASAGYECRKGPNNLYLLTKQPILEVILQEKDKSYTFNIINEARKYYKKEIISERDACEFSLKIASGEIEISIFQDGTYTLEFV